MGRRTVRVCALRNEREVRNCSAMQEESPALRVLVADDGPLIRWSLAETLAHAGDSVVEASDATETMSLLAPAVTMATP
jgi:PleD family two-component response regulator